ncbi:MAG: ST-I family heat-stable enterotoxin [Proteobacteria bacterium]|nr:ST-I family heat-stable enterotoxin [Pseudomonadota bacterium]
MPLRWKYCCEILCNTAIAGFSF